MYVSKELISIRLFFPNISFSKSVTLSIFLLIVLSSTYASAATFTIQNNCPFTIWAAAVPGGGRQLDRGQTWQITVSGNNKQGRIWARTGCFFNATGQGRCWTGDCIGQLQCKGYGRSPNTIAEYELNGNDNLDSFDISLVGGFNVPMEFSPNSGGCTRGIRCTADINGQCPIQLRAPFGCNNPCIVYRTDLFCSSPTALSKFFKDRCPYASYLSMDGKDSTFTCPGGTNYRVVFCP
ncbi:hypothetical protein CDL12_21836 [Handroanthus impetiginosus]|uniref:Thaumatin n=1 Tax=Handroanthus impetiginosus TaxID=429701 RepID=A0A2G9GJZ5_9LAMI|nr:hypothetical protein CDL12_21836 [Handroanthus impetiginosus]